LAEIKYLQVDFIYNSAFLDIYNVFNLLSVVNCQFQWPQQNLLAIYI